MPKGVFDRGLGDAHVLLVELHNKFRVMARHRGHEFILTREQLANIVFRVCHYCGCEPYQRMQLRRNIPGMGTRIPVKWLTYNGVDRVDSSKGYTVDNCVPCCGVCNRMKNDQTYPDFIARIRKILDRAEERAYLCQ